MMTLLEWLDSLSDTAFLILIGVGLAGCQVAFALLNGERK